MCHEKKKKNMCQKSIIATVCVCERNSYKPFRDSFYTYTNMNCDLKNCVFSMCNDGKMRCVFPMLCQYQCLSKTSHQPSSHSCVGGFAEETEAEPSLDY